MRQLSVAAQRYQAVLAVIGDGRTIGEVASHWQVDRRTVHRWLVRYEHEGLEGLGARSHKPVRCPHQMSAAEGTAKRTQSVPRGGTRQKHPRFRHEAQGVNERKPL